MACPVFGPPAVADKAQLLLAMSGDYRSKKEVAYLLVPAVGRGVIDMGESIKKGIFTLYCNNRDLITVLAVLSSYHEAYRKFDDYVCHRDDGRDDDVGGKSWHRE